MRAMSMAEEQLVASASAAAAAAAAAAAGRRDKANWRGSNEREASA